MNRPPPRVQRLEAGDFDLLPIEAAARCRGLEGLVFFDAALPEAGALSIVAARPAQVVHGRTDSDWNLLRQLLAQRRVEEEPGCPIPTGFAAGCVDYDGAFEFGIYDQLLAFQHPGASDQSSGTWYSVGGLHEELPLATKSAAAIEPIDFQPILPREDFLSMVRRAQDYIAAGDIYQVNLSHQFVADWAGETDAVFALYEALRHCSPAPWAALLSLAGRRVLSSSPELFLEIVGRRFLTRPIKGTRPRRPDREADETSARELVSSSKESAELIMITDLERNDLGQVCEYGSVQASDLLKLERFRQVFHLVSTVEGRLRPEVDAIDALREAVSLRAYAQKDPLIEYKNEAYEMFVDLMSRIKNEVLHNLFRSTSNLLAFENFLSSLPQELMHLEVPEATTAGGDGSSETVEQTDAISRAAMRPPSMPSRRDEPKVGRNDPCPCGSGRKFKSCHGRKA